MTLLTPKEAALALRVHPRTLIRYSKSGKLTAKKTPTGQRRYLQTEIESIINGAWNEA